MMNRIEEKKFLFLYIDKKILHNGILVYSNQTVLQDDNNVILFQFKSLKFLTQT